MLPPEETRYMLEIEKARERNRRVGDQEGQGMPVRIERWIRRPDESEEHCYARETATLVYYPCSHMLQLDGMLMRINRPWAISIKNDPAMTQLFQEMAIPRDRVTRHLVTTHTQDGRKSIWLFLHCSDGERISQREVGFWVSPWHFQGGGCLFLPTQVHKLQRWTRKCLPYKRRLIMLDTLQKTCAAHEDNWLHVLPTDLLELCVPVCL